MSAMEIIDSLKSVTGSVKLGAFKREAIIVYRVARNLLFYVLLSGYKVF